MCVCVRLCASVSVCIYIGLVLQSKVKRPRHRPHPRKGCGTRSPYLGCQFEQSGHPSKGPGARSLTWGHLLEALGLQKDASGHPRQPVGTGRPRARPPRLALRKMNANLGLYGQKPSPTAKKGKATASALPTRSLAPRELRAWVRSALFPALWMTAAAPVSVFVSLPRLASLEAPETYAQNQCLHNVTFRNSCMCSSVLELSWVVAQGC